MVRKPAVQSRTSPSSNSSEYNWFMMAVRHTAVRDMPVYMLMLCGGIWSLELFMPASVKFNCHPEVMDGRRVTTSFSILQVEFSFGMHNHSASA